MKEVVAGVVIALVALSALWTGVMSRRLLRRSLGRKLEPGEETSLKSWMQVSDPDLTSATEALEKDPFDRVLRAAGKMIFKR